MESFSSHKKESLVPICQKCERCSELLFEKHKIFGKNWFYCQKCQIYTSWSMGTRLQASQLQPTQIERIITIFLSHKTPTDAMDIQNYDFVSKPTNVNTIRRYYTIFCKVILEYYQEELNHILLEGEVEIDESHLFREKKSQAPHRRYKMSSVWVFGMKQRNSSKFVLIPLKTRNEQTLIPIIRKHIKFGSTIFTDSFSVYVNNKQKESKLQK